ncbi:MAG: hypothetical protein HY716_14530 [Planctomycetes bacterium]|nr:hypothetical protein [Planctomycetota bacterium]
MSTKDKNAERDFREFVFTATGRDTDIRKITWLDLYDNLRAELDRMDSLVELIAAWKTPDGHAPWIGVSLLLGDIHRRMGEILERGRDSMRASGW